MKSKIVPLLVSMLFVAACATTPLQPSRPENVTVTFEHPENFTDVKDSFTGSLDKVRDGYLEDLADHIKENASRFLGDGQKLAVTITDVDMAGDFEPGRGPSAMDIRVIKQIYPPRINLGFKVTDAAGATVREGTRQLRNLDFMNDPVATMRSSETLRYEKALIDNWTRDDLSGLAGAQK
ncbi:DUF3016 domain-containing protein [Termitidicoccus mucosus]|uniref:DUF3016 domain-containing protein n=2 Tax=Termitidicoccus mucosus TaxID=1184151 RepID=A0A178IQ05_9BACT|nr:hypothetical protein AW736_03755 [Opitutaceae bacterium TSB47]